jgi:hypothetical protein
LEPTCLGQSAARRSCPGCRLRHRRVRRPVLDETKHGAMLGQIGSASTDRPTRSCCDDQLNPPNIPRSSSAAAAAMQAYAPRWARSATRMNNAMCESFFATLECELLDRCRFKTQTEAHRAALEFIEGFYNPPALLDRISLTDRLRASASRCGSHPRRTPACHRARGRQGQAPPGAPNSGRP